MQILCVLEIDDARIGDLQKPPEREPSLLEVFRLRSRECWGREAREKGRSLSYGGRTSVAAEVIAARGVFQLTPSQHALSNAIYLKPKFALQGISMKLDGVMRSDQSLELVEDAEEAAILFNVGLGVVPKIVLNHKLAKISGSLRRPVVVRLDGETQLISKSTKGELERKGAY